MFNLLQSIEVYWSRANIFFQYREITHWNQRRSSRARFRPAKSASLRPQRWKIVGPVWKQCKGHEKGHEKILRKRSRKRSWQRSRKTFKKKIMTKVTKNFHAKGHDKGHEKISRISWRKIIVKIFAHAPYSVSYPLVEFAGWMKFLESSSECPLRWSSLTCRFPTVIRCRPSAPLAVENGAPNSRTSRWQSTVANWPANSDSDSLQRRITWISKEKRKRSHLTVTFLTAF